MSVPAQLDTHIESSNGTRRMTLVGEVDMSTCPLLQEHLDELLATPTPVEIDLAGISFMDSSGMRCMLTATSRAREQGQTLRLVNASPAVLRLFEVAGTQDLLDIVPPAN